MTATFAKCHCWKNYRLSSLLFFYLTLLRWLTFFNNIQQPCNVTCFPTKSEHYTSFTYRQTEHCKSSRQRQSFSCYSSRKTVCSMNARCHSQWHGVIRTPWDEDLPEIKIFFSSLYKCIHSPVLSEGRFHQRERTQSCRFRPMNSELRDLIDANIN